LQRIDECHDEFLLAQPVRPAAMQIIILYN